MNTIKIVAKGVGAVAGLGAGVGAEFIAGNMIKNYIPETANVAMKYLVNAGAWGMVLTVGVKVNECVSKSVEEMLDFSEVVETIKDSRKEKKEKKVKTVKFETEPYEEKKEA